ncbi:MAG TPA: DsbA family protein [Acidimicrobiales bacterium]
MDVAPGTIVVWGDVACPWATLAVLRLHATRRRLGLEGRVTFEHRAFALELANERPTPWSTLQAEVPVVGNLAPDAGLQVWQAPPWEWPVTVLPALAAVQVAAEQGPAAAEALDLALRLAMFADSRCVAIRSVVLDVAGSCDGVDVDALAGGLDDGRGTRAVIDQHRAAADAGVQGSPHLFLPDGSDAFNPGVEMHWEGGYGEGFPVVDADDPSVYERLLTTAAG